MEYEAGRKLDTLIAEKVMGQKVRHGKDLSKIGGYGVEWTDSISDEPFALDRYGYALDIPGYSTNIADAWRVAEEMVSKGSSFVFGSSLLREWFAEFGECGPVATDLRCRAKTAPLAICRAALKAVGIDDASTG